MGCQFPKSIPCLALGVLFLFGLLFLVLVLVLFFWSGLVVLFIVGVKLSS